MRSPQAPDRGLAIALVAAEESGDQLGAALMRALNERTGGRVRFAGVGGREMAKEGLASLFPIDDLAIIGFNDLEFCASAHPALSSVAVPRYSIAARAAAIVLEVIRGSGARPDPRRIDVGFSIIERASTRSGISSQKSVIRNQSAV